jgi:hypothetical protein
MTPFFAWTSAWVTWIPFTKTPFEFLVTYKISPLAAVTAAFGPSGTSEDRIFEGNVWYSKIFFTWSAEMLFNTSEVIPEAVNAKFVGAKTVNGPGPLNVAPNPDFFIAAFNVEKSGVDITIPLIVLSVLTFVSFLHALNKNNTANAPGKNGLPKKFSFCFIIFF